MKVRRSIVLVACLSALVVTAATNVGSAAVGAPFSCRASAVRVVSPVVSGEPIVANPGNFPCASDSNAGLATAIGPVFFGAFTAETGVQNNLDARSSVADVRILLGGTLIEAAAVRSVALNKSCGSRVGFTKIAKLDINGVDIIDGNVPGPIVIPANPLVTVAINEQIAGPDSLTVRALHVTSALLGVDIVIAESIVDCSHAG